MPVEIPKDKWTGKIRTVTLGATPAEGGTRARTITIGGDTTMPFMHFETPTLNTPAIAIEIKSRKPEDWSSLLQNVWGDAMDNPAAWAKAVEAAGADLIVAQGTEAGGHGGDCAVCAASGRAEWHCHRHDAGRVRLGGRHRQAR